jgi:hypothetical protein
MKITKRQLRRIIRETIEQDAADHYAEYPEGLPDPRRSSARDRMNSMGYTDGLEGMMPVSMSSLKDPDYMAGKKAGERDRANDPYSEDNIAQPE